MAMNLGKSIGHVLPLKGFYEIDCVPLLLSHFHMLTNGAQTFAHKHTHKHTHFLTMVFMLPFTEF